jgi:hypothetical protein
MELYERQQFDFFLQTATERFVERLEQRFRGANDALAALAAEPESDAVWLHGFVDAVFEDFLLTNVDGACFILRALPRRPLEIAHAGTVESLLMSLAKQQFKVLLLSKTREALEQHSGYQPVQLGE